MSIEKFISTEKLDEYIRHSVSELLRHHGIHDLAIYGWLDEETLDSEFLGHAMHQLEPPVDLDFTSGGGPLLVPPNPAPWLQCLAIASADFEGLMAAARLSIGLGLFQADIVKERVFSEDSHFRLHWMGSMVNLAMASDRMRDFFIWGIFRKAPREYKHGRYCGQKKLWYTTPFLEGKDLLKGQSELLSDSLAKLPPLAERVQEFRRERDAIVHDVASPLGQLERRIIRDHSKGSQVDFDFETLRKTFDLIATEHQNEISTTIGRATDWYTLLVELSNHVFIAEHEYRRHP